MPHSLFHTRREVVSGYYGGHVTILLPIGWTGRTPAELSMLVHEMVHHLQATARLRCACPQDREKLAYEAQEKWLGLFNTGLEKEFAIDQLTLLVTTHCGPQDRRRRSNHSKGKKLERTAGSPNIGRGARVSHTMEVLTEISAPSLGTFAVPALALSPSTQPENSRSTRP